MPRWFTMVRAAALMALIVAAGAPRAADADVGQDMWAKVRKSLFEDRAISTDAAAVVQLETPGRAEDAAIVPVVVRAGVAQMESRYIRKIYLVIDKNPSPIAAVFTFTPDSGRADIETRVRIDEYTYVRAIAETSDGHLYMAANFVKAAGGCSAPAGKDLQAAMANLGKIKIKLDREVEFDKPNIAQVMISHPNNSGFAMDQVTRLYVPSHYVRQVEVSYAGNPILSADIDISISENPNFRFYFVPRGPGELAADVTDSTERHFHAEIPVQAGKFAKSEAP